MMEQSLVVMLIRGRVLAEHVISRIFTAVIKFRGTLSLLHGDLVNRDGLALARSRSFVVGSGPQLPTDYDEECSAGNAITFAIANLYDSIQPKRLVQF